MFRYSFWSSSSFNTVSVYLENVANRLEIFCLTTGTSLQRLGHPSLQLPLGSIHSVFGRRKSPTAYFLFVSFLRASTVFQLSWEEGIGAEKEARSPPEDHSISEAASGHEELLECKASCDGTDSVENSYLGTSVLEKLYQVPVTGFDASLFETKQVGLYMYSFHSLYVSENL